MWSCAGGNHGNHGLPGGSAEHRGHGDQQWEQKQEQAMNLTLIAGTGKRSKLWQVLNYGCKCSVLVGRVI